jgi:hypothetical protein
MLLVRVFESKALKFARHVIYYCTSPQLYAVRSQEHRTKKKTTKKGLSLHVSMSLELFVDLVLRVDYSYRATSELAQREEPCSGPHWFITIA